MKKQPTIKATRGEIACLKFYMMPIDAGQVVEVTYAVDEDGLWCRTYDRGDRTEKYEFARYYARATEAELEFEPQNGKLPRHNQWLDVVVV